MSRRLGQDGHGRLIDWETVEKGWLECSVMSWDVTRVSIRIWILGGLLR